MADYIAHLEAAVRALGGDPSALAPPPPGPWRFRVAPRGRRFLWKGAVYASDPDTGILEVHDPEFAAALRRLVGRDAVEELVS